MQDSRLDPIQKQMRPPVEGRSHSVVTDVFVNYRPFALAFFSAANSFRCAIMSTSTVEIGETS